ncbi:MAG: CHC2 zinc finger domain-containing protein [Candidatus Hodarchaeota archaeon]
MDYYHQLKSRSDILSVARELGYSGVKSGACWQGDCPNHGSSGHRCLVIWMRIQGFRCYHCGEKGDVINLVMLFRKMDHRSAVNFLADRAGMPHLGGQDITPQEKAKREADLREKALVEDMLTEAASWYHKRLKNFPQIVDHLKNGYGFSPEIIEELQIGVAPPGTSHPQITSDLARHLNAKKGFRGKLALSGLFTFTSPKGPFFDYFRGRIIFAYWKSGKVLYMTARATDMTPVDKFECYTDKDGNIAKDDQGKPQYIKYKKIRTHDPEDEKRKHISRFIQNDTFMGEDSIRGAKEIIITEGAADLISALDRGFAAISPVTTTFREKDLEKLANLTVGADSIYIINDNEENKAGFEGALKTGKYLAMAGRNVFIVELPMPPGASKIDLNEYLVSHTADDLRQLMKEAKSVLELLIDQLPADFPKAQPVIRGDIAPILAELGEGIREHYADRLKKKTKTTSKAILAEIEAAKREKREREKDRDQAKVDPEVEKLSKAIAKDPMLFKKRIDAVNEAGVTGERKCIAMYFAALDSRLLPDNWASPNVLAVKNAGHYGSGKSYTLMMCLQIYPESAYYLITSGSPKSMYHLREGLRHKALVVTEGFQFQASNAADSEFVYAIRSLLSEGRVNYTVVEKNDEAKWVTVEKRIDGPTSFITTTAIENLESQLEDRLFTIHPDESIRQTKAIITLTARQKANLIAGLHEKTQAAWRAFHESLSPVEITISFAPKIADFINKSEFVPLATRRAFKRVMAVIQTIACCYQYQRKRDSQGRVISKINDYWMALQVVRESFQENLGGTSRETDERVAFVGEKGPIKLKTLADARGVRLQAISGWVNKRVKDGIIVWCDKEGGEFENEQEEKRAKSSGKGFIKVADSYSIVSTTGLPTPYELTGDPRWDTGGDLLEKYDLKLDSRSGNGEVSRGIKGVSTPPIDTPDGSYPIDNVKDSGDEEGGIKVSTPDLGDGDKNLEPGHKGEMPAEDGPDMEDQLAQEFGTILTAERRGENTDTKPEDPSTKLTPFICRRGCKYHDGVQDVNDGEFKEFCCKGAKSVSITKNQPCNDFETEDPSLPEGVLAI